MIAFFWCLGCGLGFIFLGASTFPRYKGTGMLLLTSGVLLATSGAMLL